MKKSKELYCSEICMFIKILMLAARFMLTFEINAYHVNKKAPEKKEATTAFPSFVRKPSTCGVWLLACLLCMPSYISA